MKKTIIAGLLALAAIIPSAIRAEEQAKEYNMVITLQNGTTITLGHNDIKDITFDGENIVVDGNIVNTIEQLNAKSEENLAMVCALQSDLAAMHAETNNKIADLLRRIGITESQIDENRTLISYLENMAYELANNSENQGDRISNLETIVNELRSMVDYVMYRVDMLETQLSN